MSSDFFFFNISNLSKRTKHVTGWMLRTFTSRDKLTMLTLFTALVMSRRDYGRQLWYPYLISHINMVEKVQRSFTRFISGMDILSYPEKLTGRLWKVWSLNFPFLYIYIIYVLKHRIVEGGPVSRHKRLETAHMRYTVKFTFALT